MRVDTLSTSALIPTTEGGRARVELLECFLTLDDDVSRCTQQAMQWLGEHAGVEQSLCASIDGSGTSLVGVAGYRIAASAVERFAISLDDTQHPLIACLSGRTPVFFRPPLRTTLGRRIDPPSPLGTGSFFALPLGGTRLDDPSAVGLLLAAVDGPELPPHVIWFAQVLGHKLDQLRLRGKLADDERRFRRERALLHSIINAVTDPILLTDTDGRLIFANAQAEALFSVEERHNEGRRRAIELNNMFLSAAMSRSALEERGASRKELMLVDPTDGSDLLFELLSSVIDDPREGSGIVSILRNISDLRRATQEIEENYNKVRVAEAEARAERDRLNLIIDSVADPILVTDAEGNISLMNTPAEKLFTVEAATSEPMKRFVQANDAHFSSFMSALLVSGSEQRRIGEVGLTDPVTGQPLPVEAIAGKVLADHGELTAVVTVLHDRREAIERAHLYEQLKRASDELEAKVRAATGELAHQNELLRRQALELEQASALKSQFLANMSHEFRTPLNAVLGYTSMVLEGVSGELNPGQRRSLGRIDSNARHLLGIINEILDITRIEAGQMPLQISEFVLEELVNEVTSELEPIIARSPVAVSARLSPRLPTLRTDRQKVKQIILNLLSNALKFTREGSVTIRAERREGRVISIAVCDTGIGIAEADQERIFEDFRQLDNTTTRPHGGTGLGLSICRRLAIMLNGTIDVESRLGEGSTFTLNIPIRLKR